MAKTGRAGRGRSGLVWSSGRKRQVACLLLRLAEVLICVVALNAGKAFCQKVMTPLLWCVPVVAYRCFNTLWRCQVLCRSLPFHLFGTCLCSSWVSQIKVKDMILATGAFHPFVSFRVFNILSSLGLQVRHAENMMPHKWRVVQNYFSALGVQALALWGNPVRLRRPVSRPGVTVWMEVSG